VSIRFKSDNQKIERTFAAIKKALSNPEFLTTLKKLYDEDYLNNLITPNN
jgi:hypothetical protein